MSEGKLCRIVKDGGQQADGQHEVGEVVEGKPEKRVDIARHCPLVGLGFHSDLRH